LERDLDTARAQLAEADLTLCAELHRTRRAQEKWNQDRASLERAKDALAAVLMQIEEVETRPVE
jgi:hypothetical protein